MYKHAESVADKNIVMLYCKSHSNPTKVGFSVSKKFGKAVRRNRIRRQLKAAVSSVITQVANGYNVVFIPRCREEFVFDDLRQSVVKLFTKSGLMQ